MWRSQRRISELIGIVLVFTDLLDLRFNADFVERAFVKGHFSAQAGQIEGIDRKHIDLIGSRSQIVAAVAGRNTKIADHRLAAVSELRDGAPKIGQFAPADRRILNGQKMPLT